MPFAARTTDLFDCPLPQHVDGELGEPPEAEQSVIIGGEFALGKKDKGKCTNKAVNFISKGSANVEICKKRAARFTDDMAHGGHIATGCLTVLIGDDDVAAPILAGGAPLVEPCDPPPPKPLT